MYALGVSSSLSNGAVIAIACVIAFLIAIIILVGRCIFVKREFTGMPQATNTGEQSMAATNTVIYEEPVGPSSDTSNKANVKLQPNPAYGVTNTVIYEEPMCISSHTSTKVDLELQPNPAYGTSCDVIMDTNPAYESCK